MESESYLGWVPRRGTGEEELLEVFGAPAASG